MSGKRKPYLCGEESGDTVSSDFLEQVAKSLHLEEFRKIQTGRLGDYLIMMTLGAVLFAMVMLWF
jgi:hypothetical protein